MHLTTVVGCWSLAKTTAASFDVTPSFILSLLMHSLQSEIERLASAEKTAPDARDVFVEFRDQLTRGEVRAAEKIDGHWKVNVWVKQGILLGFRLGELAQMGSGECLSFVDKDTFPARKFSVEDRVRVVPGGSSARLARDIRRLSRVRSYQ